ncbi:hypothetical protein PGT21_001163 [Puccinia graminis f. sp. tritici]|uniref:Uncharacterized protein n=1 Tax=Puccinia graminis f. sp. tritici TaxID=56615 RepID=A0A5B0QTQ5_PUCGR|nr:hypothetical protein PGT21_001163 [Puccinia graminis f. sp. tritici]
MSPVFAIPKTTQLAANQPPITFRSRLTYRLPTNDTSKCPRPSQAARVVRFLVLAGFIFDDPHRLRGSSDSSFWLVLSVTTLAGCEGTTDKHIIHHSIYNRRSQAARTTLISRFLSLLSVV